jgi:hypothetical protein
MPGRMPSRGCPSEDRPGGLWGWSLHDLSSQDAVETVQNGPL